MYALAPLLNLLNETEVTQIKSQNIFVETTHNYHQNSVYLEQYSNEWVHLSYLPIFTKVNNFCDLLFAFYDELTSSLKGDIDFSN